MLKPELSFLEAQVLVNASGFVEHLTPVFILALRGKEIGIYDDAMFVINLHTGVFEPYNANTDPSKQTPGIATLVPGLHPYKKGPHHIGKPNAYPAFRPATPDEGLPVYRAGKSGIYRGIAINIHRGGINTTSSAGCQTIPPGQWSEFQPFIYEEMDKAGQRTISYLLLQK